MKASKSIFVITILVLAVLLFLASPAMADRKAVVCNGDPACRINILEATPTTYQAGAPFFIRHGSYINAPNQAPIGAGHLGFSLEVDGAYVEPDFVDHFPTTPQGGEGNYIYVLMYYNFPQGLSAGSHAFTGHWYFRCWPKGEGCEQPMKEEYWPPETLTVEFVEP